MKRPIRIFDLSKSEQRVVLIIILALIAGAFGAYEHRACHFPPHPAAVAGPKPSPSPLTLKDAQ
jgi:hypothetical protein